MVGSTSFRDRESEREGERERGGEGEGEGEGEGVSGTRAGDLSATGGVGALSWTMIILRKHIYKG